MFLVTHAAVGAIVGQATGNPVLAVLGGFISHFLIDIIPHGDSNLYKSYKKGERVRLAKAYVTMDAVATTLFVLLLFNFRDFFHPLNVSLGITFGILPDLLIGLYESGKAPWLSSFHRVHFFFHNLIVNRKRDLPFRYGFLMQLIVLALLQVKVF
ncbi:hypothetical protein HY478_00180 [Candidatus Uhrbacteria bacterium]|nr:hypothetical protein [Candidatus Uhrbacteria bacterium]